MMYIYDSAMRYSLSRSISGCAFRRGILALCCLLSAAVVFSAPQKKKSNSSKGWFTNGIDIHNVSFYGGGGYSGLVGNYSPSDGFMSADNRLSGSFGQTFVGGGGGMIGVGYELWHKDFIFSVGPELRFFSSRNNINYNADVVRDDYGTMTQHYAFDGFHETQGVGQLMVPVMFGGSFDKVYFLAGAKLGYTFMGTWRQRGGLSTSVTEEMAIDDWGDMPSHQLVSGSLEEHPLYSGEGKGTNKWGFDATLSAEVGININEFLDSKWNTENEKRVHPWHFRAAAFIDYGIPMLSARSGDVSHDIASVDAINQLHGADAPGYIRTQSMHSSDFADKKLSSLLVGVKVTAVLQLTKPKQPNPRIVFWVTDTLNMPTREPAIVEIKDVEASAKSKPKSVQIRPNGFQTKRYKSADYWMVARANGYMPSDYAGDTLYLSHTKDMDTVRFNLMPQPRLVCYVHDSETKQPIHATLYFSSRTTAANDIEIRVDSMSPGVARLMYGDGFKVRVSSPDYFTDSAEVARLSDTVHYYLRPVPKVVEKLVFKHIYFATDRTEILSTSDSDLSTLYTFLTEHPDKHILITGHTDSQGTEEYNQRLSEGRAESVKRAMVERGIDPARIETNGKGESEPIDTNLTESGRQNNRRVEVSVLE